MVKALASGADAVILDLEDAVAPDAKPAARVAVAEFVRGLPSDHERPAVLVRVDAAHLDDDLAAISALSLDAIYLPKATSASVADVDERLGAQLVPLVALIESAQGLLDASAIAAHGRVRNLAIGEADLCAELGVSRDGSDALWPLRMSIVVASAAAGIDPPTAPVSTDFRDLDAYRRSTEALKHAGFGARSAIHPAQVAVIDEVFAPTHEERAEALALVTAFDDAMTRGEGVFIGPDGRMVDLAVVRHARRVLAN